MVQIPDRDQIPTNAALLNPTLAAIRYLGGSATIAEIGNRVATDLDLSESVTQILHGKGVQTELAYRLAWARTLLKYYGMVDNSIRGIWSFTPKRETTETVDPSEVVRFAQERSTQGGDRQEVDDGTARPVVQPADSPDEGAVSWKETMMDAIFKMTPASFERLCQRLLRESGFVEVEVTGRPGDGGIDGHGRIRLAGLLSFSVVFQCKRYAGSVSPDLVQAFRGAVDGRADKGLFITTGTFTRNARVEATRPGAVPIDLIDGELLVDKLKELGLGVSTRMVEEVVVDTDWFNSI